MAEWVATLYRELQHWADDGSKATLWWRDDDVQAPSAELQRLLVLAQHHHVPLTLAVIPHAMQPALAARLGSLATAASVTILQHGFAHTNHAPPDEKKAELGNHRALSAMHSELATGFTILRNHFAAQFIAVLVPPWNRITRSLLNGLAHSGFVGLSTFGARNSDTVGESTSAIRVVNTHVDLVDWKQHKQFIGAERVIANLVAHLRSRRLRQAEHTEPTGLLTHHLVHDAECWDFLAELLAVLNAHPAVQWQAASTAFACEG